MNTFILSFLINLLFYIFVFMIYLYKKKHSIIDIFWSLSVFNLALWLYLLNPKSTYTFLLTFVIFIWSFRLAYHLFKRNWNAKEDYRYVNLTKNIKDNYYIKVFFKIYFFQSVLSFFLSFVIINFYYQENFWYINNFFFYGGLILFLISNIIESIADYQLRVFKKINLTKDEVLKTGLWKYSRHPNYFGEIMQWFSIFIMTFNLSFNSLIGLLSPLMITYLIINISGITLLEKKMMQNPKYQKYAEKTNKLIPWSNKK